MKSKFIFWLLLGLAIGVLLACGIYFLTVGEVAWQEYIEQKLAPNAVIVFSSVGTILIAAIPIINKVLQAVDKFKQVTKDVNDTVANNGKNEARIANLEKRLGTIETVSKNTEKIVRLGFCNTNELVTKGYAAEIEKVGKSNDESNRQET